MSDMPPQDTERRLTNLEVSVESIGKDVDRIEDKVDQGLQRITDLIQKRTQTNWTPLAIAVTVFGIFLGAATTITIFALGTYINLTSTTQTNAMMDLRRDFEGQSMTILSAVMENSDDIDVVRANLEDVRERSRWLQGKYDEAIATLQKDTQDKWTAAQHQAYAENVRGVINSTVQEIQRLESRLQRLELEQSRGGE